MSPPLHGPSPPSPPTAHTTTASAQKTGATFATPMAQRNSTITPTTPTNGITFLPRSQSPKHTGRKPMLSRNSSPKTTSLRSLSQKPASSPTTRKPGRWSGKAGKWERTIRFPRSKINDKSSTTPSPSSGGPRRRLRKTSINFYRPSPV